MKILAMTALVAAQTLTNAQPASAAEIQGQASLQSGTFGGLRLQVPLGGDPHARHARLGLALAPTMHSVNAQGEAEIRIGEGLEFGFRQGRDTPALALAGRAFRDYRRLAAAQDGDEDDNDGLNTGEILLIAGGVVVLVAAAGAIWFIDALNDSSE